MYIVPPKGETCDVVFLVNTVDMAVFNMTSEAISSLRKSETDNEFRVIVVESNQNPKRLVPGEDHNYNSDIQIVMGSGEFSYNKALNLAFEHCESDYVAVFNNDVMFYPNWYSNIRYYMDIFNLDSASPWCNVPQRGPNPQAQAVILNYAPHTIVVGKNPILEFAGWGWIMKKTVLDKLEFPESLSFWFQDNFMCAQLHKLGSRHATVTASLVRHYGQESYKHIDPSKLHNMTIGLQSKYQELAEKLIVQ